MPGILMFIAAAAFAIFMFVASVLGGIYPNYSNGFHVGTIQKASTKGLICKATEAEIVLDGFGSAVTQKQGQGGQIRTVWTFTARDPKVMADLERFSGTKVRVVYRQWLIPPWCGETDYEAISVQQVQ